MNRNRFRLALQQLRPAQWERFEELASDFLADEYPSLRTTASPSGDGGRDAKLFLPRGDDDVVIQYSVRQDWSTKIGHTVQHMKDKFGEATVLVYATNQVVGAAADKLVFSVRKDHSIHLDVRDQNWFLERVNSSRSREMAAEALAAEIVDPFLASEGVTSSKAQALTSPEARAACVYLALQWEDDTREKGLTRLCFEGLVRSVLRDTDSDHRMPRAEIHRRVRELLPGHPETTVGQPIDSALVRLTKRFLRHWRADDEFCLTFEERQRVASRLADVEHADDQLQAALLDCVTQASEHVKPPVSLRLDELAASTRLVIDRVLWRRGEIFASAVSRGDADVEYPELVDVARNVAREIGTNPATVDARLANILTTAAGSALIDPGDEIQRYLRSFADAYTLFAFMRETPDVQAAVVKMFATGDIWLDTTVILPLFAEELVEDAPARLYTNLLAATREAGLNLYVTTGVLEEIDAHTRRCVAYSRRGSLAWEGRAPFLATAFALTGRSLGELPSWLQRFRGSARPSDDIAEYLAEQYGIGRADLEDEAGTASVALRGAIQDVWHEAHERRRGRSFHGDPAITARLVQHDVENYLGVVRRRRQERGSPFGYTSWWMTLDRTAFKVRSRIASSIPPAELPTSPVLSPDFLVNYLAIGPVRNRIAKQSECLLPLSISDLTPLDLLPPELLVAAEEVRERMKSMPEHVIRREVRDTLDRGRQRIGPLVEGGLDGLIDDLREAGGEGEPAGDA